MNLPATSTRMRALFAVGLVFFVVLVALLLHLSSPWAAQGSMRDSLWHATGSNSTYDPDNLEDINNATLGFQKILVINMPYRTDLRDSMSLAAAVTDLQVEYIDGVDGDNINKKTLPPGVEALNVGRGSIGAWRAHMNALQRMIEQNLTSALILEADVDWDLRIKAQMRDFARGTRALMQPLVGSPDQYLDPTFPRAYKGQSYKNFELSEALDKRTMNPKTSPYGDVHRWDLIWIGHCGALFPTPDESIPLGRVVLSHDETVPETQHIHIQVGNDDLTKQYPNHTRVISRARAGLCTLAYGITQKAARRILYELSLGPWTDNPVRAILDIMYRDICDGAEGRRMGTCFSVQPQLFQHHRRVGSRTSESDITEHGSGWNDFAYTRHIRWSTRLNIPQLITGDTNYLDLFEDGQPALNIGY